MNFMLVVSLFFVQHVVTAFVAPSVSASPSTRLTTSLFSNNAKKSQHDLSITYCTGCHWMMRSAWMAQELLSTFENEVHSVSLIPNRDGKGVFTIWHADMGVVWDRKTEGGFPEVKKLKQRVRDMVSPNKDLGHAEVTAGQTENCQDCPQPELLIEMIEKPGPNIAITYCTGCRWLLRASWMAQELLTTFEEELGSVTLIPHEPPPGAEFHIELNGQSVWDRTEKGGFPQITELKQMIRDEVAPTRDLGHADRKTHKSGDDLNEDDSASMRNYFGVS